MLCLPDSTFGSAALPRRTSRNRRDLRQFLAPVSAPAESSPSPRGNQTPPGAPGPPPPPPPPPPPSPETFPSPPPPPPPIQYWPSTSSARAPSGSASKSPTSGYNAPSGSTAPSTAPSTTPTSGFLSPSSLAPGPAPAVKISTAATVPSVSASVMLPSFTLQSFDTAAQAQFISMIEAAYPGNNVSVTINNIMSGSVVVNETTTFLDGDSSAANSNAQAMAISPSSIFPSATYGNITTSDVTSSNSTNPAELTADLSPTPTPAPTSGAGTFAAMSISALMGATCLVWVERQGLPQEAGFPGVAAYAGPWVG
ncbi:MAG: hypothetical protein FRX49_09185 [Trebouxia sp. A1-2]|nr:MAG: hypothetical protein FRX49_09185 [Trebouxia sp. A1-2]